MYVCVHVYECMYIQQIHEEEEEDDHLAGEDDDDDDDDDHDDEDDEDEQDDDDDDDEEGEDRMDIAQALQQLMDMGFPENQSRRALAITRYVCMYVCVCIYM